MGSHVGAITDPHTHGSGQRPPRVLRGALQDVDVSGLAGELRAEEAYASDGRNAQTIHDDGQTRVIVSVVAPGRTVGADRNSDYVMLSVAEGGGSLRRADDIVVLKPGSMVIISPGSPWTLEADLDTAISAAFWPDPVA